MSEEKKKSGCFYLVISILLRHLEVSGDHELGRQVQVGLLVSGLHEVVLRDDPGPALAPEAVILHTESPHHGGYRVLQRSQ